MSIKHLDLIKKSFELKKRDIEKIKNSNILAMDSFDGDYFHNKTNLFKKSANSD